MLDVHPPDHAVHSWGDFFVHITTIVIGLLIAVGLEQAVESIHHHNEVAETRRALAEGANKTERHFVAMLKVISPPQSFRTTFGSSTTFANIPALPSQNIFVPMGKGCFAPFRCGRPV
jgi:hypothetical protein